nr:uncharacterized protein LOC109161648 [Ipomoea trifida]
MGKIGACFRAACNHPFVMVMLFLLAVVYRLFPYVFSLLVSAFPIIFCTGVLLGALLSYSQKKAPQIRGGEEDDRGNFKTHISNDSVQTILNKDHCLPIPKLSSQEIDKKSVLIGCCDSKLPNIGLPAKHKDGDEEILDSGSDSSPDAASSVAEIVPMLDDELHPLLDEGAPPRPPVNVTCEHFSRSNDSSEESDDMGSSELERNQLLERVMERRRSRKWVSMMMESSGPPIVTTRQNPFDTLPDSYQEGLPPTPGSAPSVLIPRRNPFDIPYYSNEEHKTDHLSGENNSGLDFLDFQPKETTTTSTLFEGSEFLNVGPSIFGPSKQMAPQSNGHANSKLSSGPETESMSDGEDLEDKKEEEKVDAGDREEKKVIDDEHMFEEAVLVSKIEHASEDVGHGKNGISRQAAAVESNMSGSSLVEEERREQPVYDSSPPHHHAPTRQSLRRNFSSSSLDVHESWFPPKQVVLDLFLTHSTHHGANHQFLFHELWLSGPSAMHHYLFSCSPAPWHPSSGHAL